MCPWQTCLGASWECRCHCEMRSVSKGFLSTRSGMSPGQGQGQEREGNNHFRTQQALHGYTLVINECTIIFFLVTFKHLFSKMIFLNIKSRLFCPGWCASVDWVLACKPKGGQFDSQSGHMPGLQASRGHVKCNHTLMFLSLFLPPFSSLKVNK